MAEVNYLVEAWEIDALRDNPYDWYWNDKIQIAFRKSATVDTWSSDEKLVKQFAKLFNVNVDLRKFHVESCDGEGGHWLELQEKKQDYRPVFAFKFYPAEWA